MGLIAFSIVLQKMDSITGWPAILSFLMLWFAMGVFAVSWWAYSFPISSAILALVQFCHIKGETFAFVLSDPMFLLLFVVIVLLSILTIGSIKRG